MRALAPFQPLVILILFAAGCASTKEMPISFQNTSGWTHDRGGYFEVSHGTRTGSRLEFLQHSPDRRRESSASMLRWEHLPEHFCGEKCYGRFLLHNKDGSNTNGLMAIFMMQVDDTLWSGRFVGSPEAWEHALTFLQSAKRNR